jgi:hypothetical protein
MDAFRRESTQLKPAIQWYPATPMNKAAKINKTAITICTASLLMKTVTGAIF